MIAYRPEIDGLRAIAVLGVLLFHAGFPAFSGGYAGVDVFFVISGYLITRTILTGIDAGRFSYVGFFVNRVRRLFPALLTTIGVSLLIGALLFTPPHLKKLAEAAIVSVLGISNIYFWSEASYWDIESAFKPLLHTWSLAVEEQFYLVWPALLLIASRANNKRIARVVLLTTLGLTSLAVRGLPRPASSPGDILLDALARIRIHDRGRRDLAGGASRGRAAGCGPRSWRPAASP